MVSDPPDDAAFDLDQPTPTELIEDPHPPHSQADVDRASLVDHGKRLATLELRMAALEAQVEHSGTDRVLRQWRYLRRYLSAWVSESQSDTLEKQLRRLRKYLAVWLSED